MAMTSDKRAKQDRATLSAMGGIYCKAHHASVPKNEDGLCQDCQEVVNYALLRAGVCPTGHKGNCQDCKTPCYAPDMRSKIKELMAYAAPRMLVRHPVLSLDYLKKKICRS